VRQSGADAAPLRLGYVSWLPDALVDAAAPEVRLRLDDWVLPSHVQADRVAEGGLGLALAHADTAGMARRGLRARLLRAEVLTAWLPAAGSPGPVPAAELTVLVDTDEWAWSSWNAFAAEFAAGAGAAVTRVDDGGVTSEAFCGHVQRIGGPVLASPKRSVAPIPPTLHRRPVAAPAPVWTWSLLHRAADDPPAAACWLPQDDPHRADLLA